MVQKASAGKALNQVKLILASAAMVVAANAGAQTDALIEDNIKPIGQVCLAGQACVGGSTAGTNAAAAATTSAPVVAAPVAAAVPEQVTAAVTEPVVAAAQSDFDVAGTYQQFCFACHGTGAAGAPKLGDAEAWDPRMEKGMEAVMANVVNGLNAMPPKGICMTCSDDELQQLVEYMVSQ